MRILMWDVHGGYTDALLHGSHDHLFLPRDDNGRGGLARYGSSPPPTAREATAEELVDDPPDLVLLQRPEELDLCATTIRRTPGRDVPAVFLEHNTPKGDVPHSRHPYADTSDFEIVHVTHLNALFWDTGTARTRVIEHGLPDPGHRYVGDLARLAFVVNEPVRRWRVTGTDLLPEFAGLPVDAYGIDGDLLPAALAGTPADVTFAGNLKPAALRADLVRRRAYLHLNRWTSLGLSLIDAMLLGMPVLVLETTAAPRSVPPEAGARSADVTELAAAARRLLDDPDEAVRRGLVAREAALARHGIDRFLADWDEAFAAAS